MPNVDLFELYTLQHRMYHNRIVLILTSLLKESPPLPLLRTIRMTIQFQMHDIMAPVLSPTSSRLVVGWRRCMISMKQVSQIHIQVYKGEHSLIQELQLPEKSHKMLRLEICVTWIFSMPRELSISDHFGNQDKKRP